MEFLALRPIKRKEREQLYLNHSRSIGQNHYTKFTGRKQLKGGKHSPFQKGHSAPALCCWLAPR